MSDNLMQKVVSLCKRRGFVFPGSEIYGGLANTWDYGPLGARMLENIRRAWWERFVEARDDIFPMETGVIKNPKVWEASGHTRAFTDPLVECKICHIRVRDVEEAAALSGNAKKALTSDHKHVWTKPKQFNLMFTTHVGPVEDSSTVAYLRPETAQGMFINFKNILTTQRPRLPFGLAQIGKAFRNEISPGNFIFRTLEFEQMEIEYFVRPENWNKAFENWKEEMWGWLVELGADEKRLRWREHKKEELSHYSKRTEDIEFKFPWGWAEVYGLAYRTDYDLKNHSMESGEDLRYKDALDAEAFFPHVVEPTFGVNRTLLILLLSAYQKSDKRIILRLHTKVAPYKAAVFPLVSNNRELVGKAREVYRSLRRSFSVAWDARGNIGKRYYAQDEIGTPWCVTVDYKTLEDDTVTVRDRDTTKQERVRIERLIEALGT